MRHSTFLCAAVAVLLGLVEAQPVAAQSFLVQVNTDALGRDIIGDAANEPSIAVDPTNPNRMAIGWRQFDTITSDFRQAGVAYSSNGGLSWTASVLDPGHFRSDPVLRSDADGNFYFASLTSATSGDMFKSVDGGVTWSQPVYAYTGDKEWIAIDRTSGPGRGNVYQHWNVQFAPVAGTSFTRSTNGASSFESPIAGPSPSMKWGTMDVGANGTLYTAGATLDGSGFLFSKSTNAQYANQTPTFSASKTISLGGNISSGGINPAGLNGQTWIATDHSQTSSQGNIYVLASVNPPGPDPLDVMFTRSTDDGATWSAPVRINNDPLWANAHQWFGTMSVAPNGRIDAIWNDTRKDYEQSELFYAYSLDAGQTWLGNTPISGPFYTGVGYPVQQKIGDYYDMVSDDLGVNIAFSATFKGGEDVYFLRVPAVPEPSTVALLGVCAIGLLGYAWRSRQHRA
jgi:hypothetical protein